MATTDNKESMFNTQLVSFINTKDDVLNEVTLTQVNLTESLLTPGLQTNVQLQSKIQDTPPKNLNDYYNKNITLGIRRPILKDYPNLAGMALTDTLETTQIIYRLSKRKRISYEVEQFELDACDPTLLWDGKIFVSSNQWKNVTPDVVVKDVLTNCAKAGNLDIEKAQPPRDYTAENISPFQVVTQQAEIALNVKKNDPSFVHYMTYKDYSLKDVPTHHFRSLTDLTAQKSIFTFTYSDKVSTNENYANPEDIMAYEFPCDFDLLSDILNRVDETGKDFSSITVSNPLSHGFSLFGKGSEFCGTSGLTATTNLGTSKQFNTTDTNSEVYLRLRQARMALLNPDKIALRLTVPYNPNISVGRVITIQLLDKYAQIGAGTSAPGQGTTSNLIYGSGDYLVLNLTHTARLGGLGTTTMDCVSKTVGIGQQ